MSKTNVSGVPEQVLKATQKLLWWCWGDKDLDFLDSEDRSGHLFLTIAVIHRWLHASGGTDIHVYTGNGVRLYVDPDQVIACKPFHGLGSSYTCLREANKDDLELDLKVDRALGVPESELHGKIKLLELMQGYINKLPSDWTDEMIRNYINKVPPPYNKLTDKAIREDLKHLDENGELDGPTTLTLWQVLQETGSLERVDKTSFVRESS